MSIVIAAHNEEEVIYQRVKNCLDQDYPKEKFNVLVASDHSSDSTDAIIKKLMQEDNRVYLIQASQPGKSTAQNEAVENNSSDLIIFTDAGTTFTSDFLRQISIPFQDPIVGAVAAKLVWDNSDASSISSGGSFYWRYEHFLWQLESKLGILSWTSGAAMAVRRDAFSPIEPEFGEDCLVPLDVITKGYRVVFQPTAIAYEHLNINAQQELRARIRMTLRSFAGTMSRRHLLNPFNYPGLSWAILSHKILRWLSPYFILFVFVSNLFLLTIYFYRLTLILQFLFYLTMLIGYYAERIKVRIPVISGAYAFGVANIAFFVGVANAILGKKIIAYR